MKAWVCSGGAGPCYAAVGREGWVKSQAQGEGKSDILHGHPRSGEQQCRRVDGRDWCPAAGRVMHVVMQPPAEVDGTVCQHKLLPGVTTLPAVH